MTTNLKQNPMSDVAKPDIRNATPASEDLAEVLNETYALVIKSHTYHWNVTGPMFVSLHNLTEAHYTNMFAAADVIAERIRALGKPATVSIADLGKAAGGTLTAQEMVEDLLCDHESLAHHFHALVEVAESEGDPVTADLATERAGFHEKAAWMLRSLAA